MAVTWRQRPASFSSIARRSKIILFACTLLQRLGLRKYPVLLMQTSSLVVLCVMLLKRFIERR